MALENSLNDYSWSPTIFADCIPQYHKTIQQILIKTIVAVINKIGSADYPTDSRNKASHELCKEIVNSGILDEATLPMV